MSIFDITLHIPAEQRMFEPTTRAHERVQLPLRAQPSTKFFFATAAIVLMTAACLTISFVASTDHGPNMNMAFGLCFALAAIGPGAFAATALRDGARSLPLLSIDTEGLLDRRLGLDLVAWDEIAEAEIVAGPHGIQAVRLTLEADREPRYNPFRIGGWSASWSERRRVRVVALTLLDRRPHVLAHTILALAARHGAAIVHEPSMRRLSM